MDFNDYQTNETKFGVKSFMIIGIGAVIVFVIVVFAIRFVAKDRDEPLRSVLLQTQVQTGDLKDCQGLEEDIHDECIWNIADKEIDPLLCDQLLSDSKQKLCADGLNLRLALLSADSSKCDKIVSEELKNSCTETLRGPLTAENCEERAGDEQKCRMLSVVAQAGVKQDRRLCDALTGEFKSSCYDLVAIDDPDFDGLSTDEEINTYKSDPYKSDTDGDGYNDGDEVSAGYSPIGSAKIE